MAWAVCSGRRMVRRRELRKQQEVMRPAQESPSSAVGTARKGHGLLPVHLLLGAVKKGWGGMEEA